MFARKPTPIGAVAVTSAGTRVRLTSTLSAPTADLPTPWIFVQASEANTGVTYIGTSTVSATVYLIALGPGEGLELTPPHVRGSQGEYFLNDLYADAATNGNSVQVTYDKAR